MNDSERIVIEQKFKNIGFDLDFSSIEKYMYVNHTYYASLITKLNEIFETLCKVRKTALEPEKKFKFKITTNFDKRFYCAVRIADSAKELVYNPGNSSYYVTYTGDQIDEIELSYEILCNPYNYSREDMSLARDYLLEKSPSFRLDSELWAIQIPEGQAQGYSVENHPMYSIIIQLRDILNSKKNRVYECMVSEKRIPIKWVSEYRLFYFVKQLCPEAVFQFHCEWLGQQSYDIYLPEQRVAIEYQGEQHYRDVSFFKSDYDEYRRRDKRKLEISNANDVRLLYYSYESHVMLDRVKSFLKQNKVITVSLNTSAQIIKTDCPGLYIAPIVDNTISRLKEPRHTNEQKNEKNLSPDRMVIRQYELNGKYINQFDTYDEAVEKTGIAKRQIQRNIYGEKKSGGGFIWERVPANTVCANIDPISYNDDPQKKPVYQYNTDGELVAEFASISEAARLTGINVNGIRNVMNKKQKQAGGYLWLNNKEEDIFVNTECSPK